MLNAQKTNKKFVIIAKKFDIIANLLENPIKSRYTMFVTRYLVELVIFYRERKEINRYE